MDWISSRDLSIRLASLNDASRLRYTSLSAETVVRLRTRSTCVGSMSARATSRYFSWLTWCGMEQIVAVWALHQHPMKYSYTRSRVFWVRLELASWDANRRGPSLQMSNAGGRRNSWHLFLPTIPSPHSFACSTMTTNKRCYPLHVMYCFVLCVLLPHPSARLTLV